jgi:hypothetical protein
MPWLMEPTKETQYGSEHFCIAASSYYWNYRNDPNSRLARLIQYILHVRSQIVSNLMPRFELPWNPFDVYP